MYSTVQFIAYEIDTTPADVDPNVAGSGRYLGSTSTILHCNLADKDIGKRCTIMKNAISVAAKNMKVSKSDTVLKIFMAPEFYFRNTEGAYPVEKISDIMSIMKKETSKPQYAHWLFVLGTAIGYLKHDDKAQTEVFNIALVQKGGSAPPKGGGLRDVLVYKEYVSHIDFLRSSHSYWNKADGSNRTITIHGQTNRAVRPTEGSRDLLSTVQNVPNKNKVSEVNKSGIGGGSIFTIDGITFGLEVCLDHAKQRLKLYQPQPGENLIQVQLIPSAGMVIYHGQPDGRGGNYANSVACIPNGLIFNVDGVRSGSAAKILTAGKIIDISETGSVPISLSGAAYITVTHDKYFQNHGCIRFYQSKQFPPAQVQA